MAFFRALSKRISNIFRRRSHFKTAEKSKIECPVCLSTSDEAVTVGCGHAYCFQCINTWAENGKTSCPLCRAKFEKYENTEWRLLSFKNWPAGHFINPLSLAENGLVHIPASRIKTLYGDKVPQVDDFVQCVDCNLCIFTWNKGDTPAGEHTRLNKESGALCRFTPDA